MLKMEDSGIDSDSKSIFNLSQESKSTSFPSNFNSDKYEEEGSDSSKHKPDESSRLLSKDQTIMHVDDEDCENISLESNDPLSATTRLLPTSLLQKRLERQIQKARKIRQREQSHELLPKKLIPRSRLKVPRSQTPVVTKTDSHPLVTWESESDDDLDYHPISKSTAKEITEQLIKDGYNLDLTPDDEDLDLIPPKPLTQRCVCCNLSCMCLIQ